MKVIELTGHLQPGMPELLRDRGIIYHKIGKLRLAVQFYERYLESAPKAPDAQAIQTYLQVVSQSLARLN